jgi:hypothetical protein
MNMVLILQKMEEQNIIESVLLENLAEHVSQIKLAHKLGATCWATRLINLTIVKDKGLIGRLEFDEGVIRAAIGDMNRLNGKWKLNMNSHNMLMVCNKANWGDSTIKFTPSDRSSEIVHSNLFK